MVDATLITAMIIVSKPRENSINSDVLGRALIWAFQRSLMGIAMTALYVSIIFLKIIRLGVATECIGDHVACHLNTY